MNYFKSYINFLLVFGFLSMGTYSGSGQNLKVTKRHPEKTVYHHGAYRNLFLEAGYSQTEIDKKVEKASLTVV